ncbi:MAG: helix-turn-helix transcriptional regulator [Ilumatobacteraceae bacterium]
MRAGRLVDMLLTLQRRGRLTAAELAAELEVSPRTILRDVDALSSAGVPIYAVQGVGGGIELVDRFRTQLTAFTSDEAVALLLAGQPVVAQQLGLGAAAGAARRKLLDALPETLRLDAERIDGWFVHDPLGRGTASLPYGELRRLSMAIARTVEVEISLADQPPIAVRPLGVVLDAGSWQLVALTDTGPAVVCIDALRGLRITRTEFARPAGFDLAAWWRDSHWTPHHQ